MKRITIKEVAALSMGLILKRKLAKDESEIVERRKVCTPKLFSRYGKIDLESLEESEYVGLTSEFSIHDKNRKITRAGDIIIKLCSPYSAVIIDEHSEGLLIPSFCALVEYDKSIDPYYLLAFFNSSYYQREIKSRVTGVIAAISIGKIEEIEIPLPNKMEQTNIGKQYIQSMEKIELIDKISRLESKRNDYIFEELTSKLKGSTNG